MNLRQLGVCGLRRLELSPPWVGLYSVSVRWVANGLESSARLSYLPTKTIRIRLKDLCVVAYLDRF